MKNCNYSFFIDFLEDLVAAYSWVVEAVETVDGVLRNDHVHEACWEVSSKVHVFELGHSQIWSFLSPNLCLIVHHSYGVLSECPQHVGCGKSSCSTDWHTKKRDLPSSIS